MLHWHICGSVDDMGVKCTVSVVRCGLQASFQFPPQAGIPLSMRGIAITQSLGHNLDTEVEKEHPSPPA